MFWRCPRRVSSVWFTCSVSRGTTASFSPHRRRPSRALPKRLFSFLLCNLCWQWCYHGPASFSIAAIVLITSGHGLKDRRLSSGQTPTAKAYVYCWLHTSHWIAITDTQEWQAHCVPVYRSTVYCCPLVFRCYRFSHWDAKLLNFQPTPSRSSSLFSIILLQYPIPSSPCFRYTVLILNSKSYEE